MSPRSRSHRTLRVIVFGWLAATAAWLVHAEDDTNKKKNNNDNEDNNPYRLDESSVVLITGAAGFLGSELAMALHRTYQPRKLICIDALHRLDSNNYGSSNNSASNASANNNNNNNNDDLALTEFKRQRTFHVWQTLGVRAYFYRVDFRPSVPEYFDTSAVPVLHRILEEHDDITHVVHLASQDDIGSHRDGGVSPVVPRSKGDEKAGMMESILEELRLWRATQTHRPLPRFVYASSGDVYPIAPQAKDDRSASLPRRREDTPLTTPSSRIGTARLLDELVAQAYADHPTLGIPSVGLRLFDVYGPWGPPSSAVFRMADLVVAGQPPLVTTAEEDDNDDDEYLAARRDYVYIDDAVDALMSAMQLPTAPTTKKQPRRAQALVINVGSGTGTSLRTMASTMQRLVRSSDDGDAVVAEENESGSDAAGTSLVADLSRAQTLLGYEPQVSLAAGLVKLLAWHYDRAYPYGSGASLEDMQDSNHIASKGIFACSKYDTECLKGTPVFPCASECSHPHQCKRTLYDDVLELTRTLTHHCETVLYTVSLDATLQHIPSTELRVSSQSVAYVESSRSRHCNIAFVDASSPLYTSLEIAQSTSPDGVIRHGFWSLVPVAVTEAARSQLEFLSLIPKLSPGQFWADTVETAIYCDPDILIDSVPRLLEEAKMQPRHETIPGATVLVIGQAPTLAFPSSSTTTMSQQQQSPPQSPFMPKPPSRTATPHHDLVQEQAYRTMRLAVIHQLTGDGFARALDSGLLVHTLRQSTTTSRRSHHAQNTNSQNDASDADDELLYNNDDDARLFRCDVFGEVVQWKVNGDTAAFEFILGLHDMWSRVMVQNAGSTPWWIGDDVTTVRAARRTTESSSHDKEQEQRRRLQEKDGAVVGAFDAGDHDDDTPDTDQNPLADPDNIHSDGEEHNGFGDVVQDALQAVFGYTNNNNNANENNPKPQERFHRPQDGDEAGGGYVVDDDDDVAGESNRRAHNGAGEDGTPPRFLPPTKRDPSTYDVWMGILSSTKTRYFGRLVNLEAVGVYRSGYAGGEESSSGV